MTYRYTYMIVCTADEMKNRFYVGKHTTTNLNDGYKGSGRYIQEYHKKYPNQYIKCILGFYNNEYELVNAENELIMSNRDNPFCLNVLHPMWSPYRSYSIEENLRTNNIIVSLDVFFINISIEDIFPDWGESDHTKLVKTLLPFLKNCLYVKTHNVNESFHDSYNIVLSSPLKTLRFVTLMKLYVMCASNNTHLNNFVSAVSINYEYENDEENNGIAHNISENIALGVRRDQKYERIQTIYINTIWKDIDDKLNMYGKIIDYIIHNHNRTWNSVMLFILLDKPIEVIQEYFNLSKKEVKAIKNSSGAEMLEDALVIFEKTIYQKLMNL